MALQIGIVGLPNVGKSTLFNALLRREQAFAANYPFATIEPNVGVVPVPDSRLQKLQKSVAQSERMEFLPPIVPATVRFVDIAGLVKGASEGAGLGNKFLSHIREVDLICQVVRSFPDEEVIREGSFDPISDIDLINTELVLADLQTLQKADSGKQIVDRDTTQAKRAIVDKLITELNSGKLASLVKLTGEERELVRDLQLLTMKKMLFVLNVNTATNWKAANELAFELSVKRGLSVCVIDAKLEADLAQLSADEQEQYLQSLGIANSGVDQLIQLAYETLDLISFLTAGEKEVRAWTVRRGTKAPQAAGVIHSDFEKGFIKAEVVKIDDFTSFGGWKACREAGRVAFEGKEYEVLNGDIIEFKVST